MFLSVVGNVMADEKPSGETTVPNSTRAQAQYLATVAEYRLDQPFSITASEKEVLDYIRDQKMEPVETVRRTVMSDAYSHVQFGKRVTVTTGKIVNRDVVSRQTETMEIGTILDIRIERHERGATANLEYTSSQLEGDGTEDSPPDITTTTVQTTQVFELGKPRLVGARSGSETSFVIATISELP
jgi:hypothetical protein